MVEVNQIDPKLLGQRLAEARKARGVTQEDAAKHLECSRPILIAIEKGTRPAEGPGACQTRIALRTFSP